MAETKKRRLTLELRGKMVDFLDEIMEHEAYPTFAAAINQAILNMHKDTVLSYRNKLPRKGNESPQELVSRKKAQQAELERQAEEKQIAICQELDGEVRIDESGNKVCDYFTYSHKNRFANTLPLSTLDEELVKNQYFPSREKVEKYQKEGLTDYED